LSKRLSYRVTVCHVLCQLYYVVSEGSSGKLIGLSAAVHLLLTTGR